MIRWDHGLFAVQYWRIIARLILGYAMAEFSQIDSDTLGQCWVGFVKKARIRKQR